MTTAADFIESSGMGFEVVTTAIRQRATLVVDPYDPDAPGVPDWSKPDEAEVVGFVSSQSSVEQEDPVRGQVVSSKVFVLEDPNADVQRGDRLKIGDQVWTVTGFPEADIHPWTGWQPTRVCALEGVVG